MTVNNLASHASSSAFGGGGLNSKRILFPAIVVPFGNNDRSEQGRIRARIVAIDDTTGEIIGRNNRDIGSLENYDSLSGTDRGIPDSELVLCIPFLPQFVAVTPQVGEMVYLILENAADKASTRYWIGPIITSKLKLPFQGYEDAVAIFDKTNFYSNKKLDGSALSVENIFPKSSEVALQGRQDADLILKNRELLLIAGKMNVKNFTVNTKQPSFLRLKQIDSVEQVKNKINYPDATHNILATISKSGSEYTSIIKVIFKVTNFTMENDIDISVTRDDAVNFTKRKIGEYKEKYKRWKLITEIDEFLNEDKMYFFKAEKKKEEQDEKDKYPFNSYSLAELVSTNINFHSPRGKFRGDEIKDYEISEDLKALSELANSLHPSVFGDELVKLLDLMIRYLIDHIHQPQSPPIETSISDTIKTYTVKGNLQNLLSNLIRIN